MSRKIERTFEVSVSVERAWKVMTDPKELNKWYFPITVASDGSTTTEILGEERTSEVVSFEAGKMFHTRTVLTGREGFGIQPGTRDMVVVFEATDTGARIVMTHSGFGDGDEWDQDLEGVGRGVDETIADLILYLETGVPFPRHHHAELSWLGFKSREIRTGLQVTAVQPGTFADKLGLEAGDLLVELGGASVFGFSEVNFFSKEHAAGEQASAAWIRDGRLKRGSAELGPRVPEGSAVAR